MYHNPFHVPLLFLNNPWLCSEMILYKDKTDKYIETFKMFVFIDFSS
jgi:hypothetical protein